MDTRVANNKYTQPISIVPTGRLLMIFVILACYRGANGDSVKWAVIMAALWSAPSSPWLSTANLAQLFVVQSHPDDERGRHDWQAGC